MVNVAPESGRNNRDNCGLGGAGNYDMRIGVFTEPRRSRELRRPSA